MIPMSYVSYTHDIRYGSPYYELLSKSALLKGKVLQVLLSKNSTHIKKMLLVKCYQNLKKNVPLVTHSVFSESSSSEPKKKKKKEQLQTRACLVKKHCNISARKFVVVVLVCAQLSNFLLVQV